ncbi:MAG: hypothetical protein ACO1NU_05090 [Arcticibacter sp.]
MEESKRFVPYVQPGSPTVTRELKTLPLIQISDAADSITSIVVENVQRTSISSLWLRIKNASVSRQADLLGSDDMRKWFAIDESITLQQSTESKTDTHLQSFSMPVSKYRYFRINVRNQKKSPLKILQVGTFSMLRSDPEFITLPAPTVTRKDSSDKTTYLYIKLKADFQVDKLIIPVTYPTYFKRQVLVFYGMGKQKELISETELSSGDAHEITLSNKFRNLELQIQNEDNPPLEIGPIQARQQKKYLLAYLESGKSYELLTGDRRAEKPGYDLAFFSDSAQLETSIINHAQVLRNPLMKVPSEAPASQSKLVLWTVISAILVLLSFSTWKMIAALKSRTES